MIDSKTLALFKERYKSFSIDGKGDDHCGFTKTMTLGLVVNTDDPLEAGRLQIFCPALNDNPKKIQHLPWAIYISPYTGSINNSKFARGTGDGESMSVGAVHYGFWGIPELGAHVLVGCIDGDPRRRFYIGAAPELHETHTMFTGRFDWDASKGTPDGPFTSDKKPIQPLYDNLSEAFKDKKSREWKSRGADFQPMANLKENDGAPSKVRGEDYLDDSYDGIAKREKDKWVRDILGAHGYDWTGFKGVGALKSSRVFGFSTPGFHSFSMDDRPFNCRMKLRTSTGHMILMDDTNERIYIMTNKGKNYIEMDSNGNIDVYSERRVSIGSAKDINLTSAETIRLHAGRGIHMYAGHSEEDRPKLESKPLVGEIRIESSTDLHMLANNIRSKSKENTYREVGINLYEMVGDSSFLDVKNDINVRTLVGDYIKSVEKDLFETVKRNSKRLSHGTSAIASQGNSEIFSFDGTIAVGSKGDASFKSATGNIDFEAMGQSGDRGSIRINTPRSQVTVGDDGIQNLTSKSISSKAAETLDFEIAPDKANTKNGGSKSAPLKFEGVPSPGDCNVGNLPPVQWSPGQPLTIEQAAQVCYNAGFRGQDLVIATALIGGESSYNPSAKNGSASDGKWGPAVGLFQIRTLNNPDQYAGTIDALRDNRNGQLEDPNHNARVAYKIFEKMHPAGKWSVGKWESFQSDRINNNFNRYVSAAATAVQNICGGNLAGSTLEAGDIKVSVDEEHVACCDYDDNDYNENEMLYGGSSPSAGSLISLSTSGVTIQSMVDIDFKAMASGYFNQYSNIINTLNTNVAKTNMLMYFSSILVPAIETLASSLNKSFSIPFSFDVSSISQSLFSSALPTQLTQAFGDLQQLNATIQSMGGLGLQLPLTLENIVGQLAGNTSVLSALGLPTNINFPIDISSFTGFDPVGQLNKLVSSIDIPLLELPTFRKIADRIFQNNAYPLGEIELDL